jgi:FAD dependent oxidoreductase TIGR03364
MNHRADVAIVGAGILGLAHAYAAANRGKRVVVFERGARASGASVRNFGLLWPIGQPHGEMYQLALRSRDLWLAVLNRAHLPHWPTGSLHLVYRTDEADVAREFADLGPGLGFQCSWLNTDQVRGRSVAAIARGLIGALWSPTEVTVDPRVTVAALPEFLHEQLGVEFRFGCAVNRIELPCVEAGGEVWKVDHAVVCSGDDFESLYPQIYAGSGLTRVKLQMLRTVPQPGNWRLGPALAAGLTLRFYSSFSVCSTLPTLKERIATETPEYDRWGIHGLVSQTTQGELTLGDSHEYGLAVDIFNKDEIDQLMLRYISTFLDAPDLSIAERWYGVYAKHPEKPYLTLEPAPGVRIVTSPGGAGMTLSFGIAERTIEAMGL